MKIDWGLLRTQKADLIDIIQGDKIESSQRDSLVGILHLIDSIQDDAVDVHGVDENEVLHWRLNNGYPQIHHPL